MMRQVEQIVKEGYENILKKIRALPPSGESVGLMDVSESLKCEAIIAKGKRENMPCNARAQPGTTRCKTHSGKSKTVPAVAPPEEAAPTLLSALEPDVVFGMRGGDDTVVFEPRPDTPEHLF